MKTARLRLSCASLCRGLEERIMKKMRIRIGKDGKTTVSVEGACGPECLEFTKAFEEAVGLVEKRDLTEDYEKGVCEKVEEKIKENL